MNAPKCDRSKSLDNSVALLITLGVTGGVLALLLIRGWISGLPPLAGGLAKVGVLSTLVFVGAFVFGLVISEPDSKKAASQSRAEAQIGANIMLWSAIVAIIAFCGVAAVGKYETNVRPRLDSAFIFNTK